MVIVICGVGENGDYIFFFFSFEFDIGIFELF